MQNKIINERLESLILDNTKEGKQKQAIMAQE
jgi:hypothetical protein